MDSGHAGGRPLESCASSLRGQLMRFAAIGVVSTLAYILAYLAFRDLGLTAQAANAFSLLLTAIANTIANRRITFGIRDGAHAARHLAQGVIAFGAGLVVTSAALVGLHALTTKPAWIIEVGVLVAANASAIVVRFALYRHWVFRPRRCPQAIPPALARKPGAGASQAAR